mgnify:CR=1 FL=1
MDWFDKFCLGKYVNRPQEQIIIDLIELNENGKQQRFKSALFSMMLSYIDYLETDEPGAATCNLMPNVCSNWYSKWDVTPHARLLYTLIWKYCAICAKATQTFRRSCGCFGNPLRVRSRHVTRKNM